MSADTAKNSALKIPSTVRFQRVENLMKVEPVFKGKLGDKTFVVEMRGNEKSFFSKAVAATVLEIHRSGGDAVTMPPSQVRAVAFLTVETLDKDKDGSKWQAILKPFQPHAAPVKKVEKPKAQAKAPVVQAKSQEPDEKPTAPTPVPKAKPVRRREVKAQDTERQKAEAAVIQAAQAAEKPAVPVAAVLPQAEKPTVLPSEQVPSAYLFLSTLSLTVSLRNLSLLDDHLPGFEKRRASIDFLLSEYTRLKDVIVPIRYVKAEETAQARPGA